MAQHEVDQMQKLIREKIAQYGYMVTGVYASADSGLTEIICPHAYTIGLTTLGLPELTISGGFDPKTLQGFLNKAARRHAKLEIHPGETLDFLANVPFRAVQATAGNHVQQALNYYGDPNGENGMVRLIQILWPDRDGNYPDESGWTGGENTQELFL